MSPRLVAAVIVAALVVSLGLVGYRGVLLVSSGDLLQVALGLAVLVLPVVGAYVAWREVQFGFATQRLARELDAAGRWPDDDVERAPSGRPSISASRRARTPASPGRC